MLRQFSPLMPQVAHQALELGLWHGSWPHSSPAPALLCLRAPRASAAPCTVAIMPTAAGWRPVARRMYADSIRHAGAAALTLMGSNRDALGLEGRLDLGQARVGRLKKKREGRDDRMPIGEHPEAHRPRTSSITTRALSIPSPPILRAPTCV